MTKLAKIAAAEAELAALMSELAAIQTEVTVDVTGDELHNLEKTAAHYGISVSELVRKALGLGAHATAEETASEARA